MEKPKYFLVYKIIGFIGLGLALIAVISLLTGFGNFNNNNFAIGVVLLPVGFFMASIGLVNGFKPEITKRQIKTFNYIQENNKNEIKKIVDTSADITEDAITKSAKAVKKGFTNTVFCKSCGKTIDEDSIFCRYCGHKQ